MDAYEKRLIELIVEAARGKRSRGDDDVLFIGAEDAVLLRGTPGVRIAGDGPQVGGKSYCTDFYYEDWHFRHVYTYDSVTETITTAGSN